MDVTNCDKEVVIITLLCFFHHENKDVFSIMKNILLLIVLENGTTLTLFFFFLFIYIFVIFIFPSLKFLRF
jgi:hypothetical protein